MSNDLLRKCLSALGIFVGFANNDSVDVAGVLVNEGLLILLLIDGARA